MSWRSVLEVASTVKCKGCGVDSSTPASGPTPLVGLFSVSWDYPNIEPPEYLIGVSPAHFQQEQERVRARFQEAV
jgi:hypothetical protein